MKIAAKTLARLAVTTILFTAIAIKADIGEAVSRVVALPWLYIAAPFALSMIYLYIQALKTKILLPECPVNLIFRVNLVAQFYGMALFGQIGGDVAKTVYLARSHPDVYRLIAAMLLDRITGLIALLILAFAGLIWETGHFDRGITVVVTVLLSALLASLLLLLLPASAAIGRRLLTATRWKQTLMRMLDTVLGFATKPRLFAASVIMGLVTQSINVAGCALVGIGIGIHVTFAVWAVVICLMSLVLLAPISVGGIGLRDVTLVGLLADFGVAPDAALALSLTMLGLQAAGAMVGGLTALMPWPSPASTPT